MSLDVIGSANRSFGSERNQASGARKSEGTLTRVMRKHGGIRVRE